MKGDYMKVILLDNIKGVGKKDEVINASDGYARNFLLPRKLAVEANAENMSKLKNKQDSVQHKKDVEKEKAEEIAKKLKDITVVIKVKSGNNGRIFGGVTSKEISENLKSQYKIDIDKRTTQRKYQLAEKLHCPFYLVSAADGTNVVRIFEELIKIGVNHKKNPKNNYYEKIMDILDDDDLFNN